MHQSLKQVLLFGSMLALVGTTACSTMQASFGDEAGGDGSAVHASNDDILKTMAHDSELGGE